MKITSIKYEELLPTGNYLNARYGIEISLDTDSEVDQAFALAKQIVSDTHQKNFPALYKDGKALFINYKGEDQTPRQVQVEKVTGTPDEQFIAQIKATTKLEPKEDMNSLESFRRLVESSGKQSFKTAFDEQFKKLSGE
jgi:hypothetical protein